MFGSIRLKLRPIKLAFLVNPRNKDEILQAMQINSTLWGGSYNPIIPIYKKTPPIWTEKGLPSPKSEDIIRGYVDAYDPDVLVQCTDDLPSFVKELGIEIIKPDEIWQYTRADNSELIPLYGVGLFELYQDIFDEYFKYKTKYPVKVIIPKIPKNFTLFWVSVFGQLPLEIEKIVNKNYVEQLEIEEEILNENTLRDFYKGEILTPLKITKKHLDRSRYRSFHGAYVYFMDISKNIDIIDFWNLRALGKSVIPLPVQFKDNINLKKLVTEFLTYNRNPYKHNPSLYSFGTLLKSRMSKMDDLNAYAKSLVFPKKDDNNPFYVIQHWYPRLWHESYRNSDQALAEEVHSEDSEVDFIDTKRKVHVPTLSPKFIFGHYGHGSARFVNDVSFSFYESDENLAGIFPKSRGENLRRMISDFGSYNEWRISKNGLSRMVSSKYAARWNVPLAEDVFFAWLKDLGFDAKLSSAGMTAKQLFSHLNGFVRPFANFKLLRLLEFMNGGLRNKNDIHNEPKTLTSPNSQLDLDRYLTVGEVKGRLLEFSKKTDLHEYLLTQKVFKVGIKLQCPICSKNDWYSLEKIKENIECLKCLKIFPVISILNTNTWCYKTTGLFSIPRYADGAYCVLFSINFFQYVLNSIKITASFSFTAEDSMKSQLEADFGLIWEDFQSNGVVFGECKTFGNFENKDFSRMRLLAKKFPGAILAFCTLKKELTKNEITEISKIANKGRKYWKNNRPINPILILTRHELLSHLGPPYCWKELGLDKEFTNARSLIEICHATQQIHLKMPRWEENWDKERQKKRRKK